MRAARCRVASGTKNTKTVSGRKRSPCRERRVAQDVLEVDRQVREHREHARRDAERRDGHSDECGLSEQPHVEHRPLLTQLDHDEQDEEEDAGDERGDDQAARPAVSVAAEDPEDDQEERCRERHQTQNVRASRLLVPRLRDAGDGDHEREDADRDVHEEDPPPPETVGEDAADERPAGDRGADRRAPDRERAEALGPPILVPDESKGRGEQRGSADPLQRTGDIERAMFHARPQSSDENVKHTTPAMKIKRRPYRSARAPAVRISAASVSA